MSLPLSTKQQATLRALGNSGKTTAEIRVLVGVGKGAAVMLQSLYQQGLISYVGGPGVKSGKGKWNLTDRGKSAAARLGGPYP